MILFARLRTLGICALLIAALSGCATTGHPKDPLEPINRGIYQFNDAFDTVLLKPAAEVYKGVLPEVVRTGVSNFFANIGDILIALNNLLQGKIPHAVSDAGRVAINTTVGLLGLIDVATEVGLEKHNEDFGQTLGFWGIGDYPYLVLPFFGPSNLRDAVGTVADIKYDPIVRHMNPVDERNRVLALRAVNRRAELLETSKILETAALDPYEFLRDAYIQRRRNLVYDGNPPPENDIDENGDKQKPRGGTRNAPAISGAPYPSASDHPLGDGARVVSGAELTPAQAEYLRREAARANAGRERRSEPAAAAPRAAPPGAGDSATTRVVRLWLPSSSR
ncbi:MAG: VacJ family lipoprotein [Betaproteobacteria bacterium]|nr:VacJ family lipoprotein [Betaproteobacteria bacterium]